MDKVANELQVGHMLTQPSRSRDPGILGAWPRSGPPESRCQPGLPQSGPCWPASAGREGPAKAPGVYKALPWARNCLTFWPRASAGSGPGSSRCGARAGGRTRHPSGQARCGNSSDAARQRWGAGNTGTGGRRQAPAP